MRKASCVVNSVTICRVRGAKLYQSPGEYEEALIEHQKALGVPWCMVTSECHQQVYNIENKVCGLTQIKETLEVNTFSKNKHERLTPHLK